MYKPSLKLYCISDDFHRKILILSQYIFCLFKLITLDKGLIEVGADVYYKIASVEQYITSIQDMNHSLRILVQSSFKNNFVQRTLNDIETDKLGIVADTLVS